MPVMEQWASRPGKRSASTTGESSRSSRENSVAIEKEKSKDAIKYREIYNSQLQNYKELINKLDGIKVGSDKYIPIINNYVEILTNDQNSQIGKILQSSKQEQSVSKFLSFLGCFSWFSSSIQLVFGSHKIHHCFTPYITFTFV